MVKKKIITIVGARPQIIKSSAISRAISGSFSDRLEEIIVHTGQHYDDNMSKVFFDEMKIPRPNYNLEVGSDSHAKQTAKMMIGLEEIFLKENPVAIIVYGDTNSTIAGALAASKIHIPVVHVEAGLRSFNKSMPEEINRIACDHMSTLLFTPTKTGVSNLASEGFENDESSKVSIDNPMVLHCGDIMYDNSLYFSEVSKSQSTIISDLELNEFVLCTIHRDSNTDVPENLSSIFEALLEIGEKYQLKIVLPLHPRTNSKIDTNLSTKLQSQISDSNWLKIIPPAGFLDIIALEQNSKLIITDSGGLQKEAFFFEKPCVILRPQTEWVEIVENGNALLAAANKQRIIDSVDSLMNRSNFTYPNLFGDGRAADFICKALIEHL